MTVATTSVDAFLDLLDVSQLVKPALMTKVREQVPLLGTDSADAEKVAKSLVKSQLLSAYQAARLLSGHADGFYLGKYKLLDVLGQGGMGVVYLAEQITMNRLVALKVIGRISKNKNDSLARFQREARAVAQLSHPNIIQAYDFDQIDGIPFISMEFVEGIDVERQLTKFGRMDWRQAADYAMQAASGLEAARQAKFVHRDIKPGNLLVDTNGIVKILDLGLVVTKEQRRNDSLTTTQDQVGTVDYMSPEQALNSHGVDIRADIYSLGGVLHFMLTGQIPFPGKSSAEKLLQHQSKPATPVRQLGVDVPEEFERLILKMLEKKPTDRFQSPLEVAEALKPFAEKKTPPYSASAIKHPKAVFVPLLGRSPDPQEINVKGQLSGVLSPLSDSGPQVSTTATKARSMDSTGVKPIPSQVANAANKSVPNAIVKREPSQIQQRELARSHQTAKSSGPRSTVVVIPNQNEQSEEDMFADLPLLPSAPSPRRIRKSNDKKKGGGKNESGTDSKFLMMVGGGLTAALLIFGLVVFMSGGRPSQTALAVTSPSDDLSAKNGLGAQAAQRGRFIRVPLDQVANTISTKGMFNDEGNTTERFILNNWNSREVEGVPFSLIDPRGDTVPNVIMLNGGQGKQAPNKPKSVSIPTNFAAKEIHLLSGVGGYCFPSQPKGTVSMTLRLTYADGSTENHDFVNGVDFADYIRRVDVPGSKFAFDLREQQMRYLRVLPRRPDRINTIEFLKGPDKTAPLIMAMTLEEPVLTANSTGLPVAAGIPSFDRWKAYSEELRKDPDMVAYYTFSDPKDNGDVLHSQATAPKFGSMNGKVHGGAAWVPGRFSQKRALQFGGKGSGHYVSLGDGDSRNCNFTTPFTVAAWFKVDKFDAAHQVIVAKGDQSWRLQRDTEKNMLHLALNNYVAKNSDSSAPTRHQFAKVEGITPVNDNKWHLAVGVYDFAAARPTITLYLDGQLEGVAKIDLPKETNSAVMIGANSDTFGRNEFRYWRGLIDEVMILNRGMKPAEIEQMYEAGRPVQ